MSVSERGSSFCFFWNLFSLSAFFCIFIAFFLYSINLSLILALAFSKLVSLSIFDCRSSIPSAVIIFVNISSNWVLHFHSPLINALTFLKNILIFHHVLFGAHSILPVLKKLEKLSANHSSACFALHPSDFITCDIRYVLVSGSIISNIAWSNSCGAVLSFICSDKVNKLSTYLP